VPVPPDPVRGPGAQRVAAARRLHATDVVVRYRRSLVLPGATPAVRAARPTPQAEWGRSPDLVWSASRGAPAGTSVVAPPAAASAWPSRPPRSVPELVTAVETPPSVASAGAARITALDPALVDRLTDDVIRQVERRVRIERERRGI
jgi:hypothetical protein